jgi:hypothetical protein
MRFCDRKESRKFKRILRMSAALTRSCCSSTFFDLLFFPPFDAIRLTDTSSADDLLMRPAIGAPNGDAIGWIGAAPTIGVWISGRGCCC